MSQNDTLISSLKDEFENQTTNNTKEEVVTSTFIRKKNNKKFIFALLISVVVFLLGVGWFVYTSIQNTQTNIKDPVSNPTQNTNNIDIPSNASNTDFPNPINGRFLTKDEYDLTVNRKPVAIMVNNHVDARPQAGISQADVIYEMVAEGGISRLMPIFHSIIPDRVGPIRSARIYFMQAAAEYWPIFSHWGIAYRPAYELNLPPSEFNALLASGQAETDPRADARAYIDEIGLPVANTDTTPSIFYRESIPGVAIEHTGYVRFNELHKAFSTYYPEPSWSEYQEFDVWSFKDAKLVDESLSNISTIKYNFWNMSGFETIWKYDSSTNSYIRNQGGIDTKDRNNDQSPLVANLIVQFVTETKLNDKKAHLLYDVVGKGTAFFYIDGKKIEGTWSKSSARERTLYTDKNGNAIEFNRGLFWITLLPTYSTVSEN